MENKFELILSTESRVLSTNIADFEKQAEQFLATLTDKFETDEDFGAVAEEIKTLEDVEKKIRAAIKSAQNGEIAKLIESAEKIAEKFRQERLNREKLVKAKKDEVKQGIINTAFKNISQVRYSYESDISLALEKTMPKQDLLKRLQGATARRSTLATLTKAVQAEEHLILAELAQESARLTARRKLIPITHDYLFKDWLELITGTDDMTAIVEQRLQAEAEREQAQRAKAEAEKVKAEAKAEAEKAQQEAPKAEVKEQSVVEKPQENSTALSDEPTFKFEIRIGFSSTQSKAIEFAKLVKAQYGLENNVSLKKIN